MKISNKSSFTANIKTIATNNTVKTAVQNACIQAIEFYKDNGKGGNGDTGYLTQLMDAGKANKGIRTKCLLGFIKAHANVTYGKIKNKQGVEMYVFKKATGKKGAVETKELSTQWFDFVDVTTETDKPVDFMARAKSLFTAISNNEKKLKDGTETKTNELQALLSGLLEA